MSVLNCPACQGFNQLNCNHERAPVNDSTQTADALRNVPCPSCGEPTLRIEMLLTAKLTGSYSIAGAQPKVVAQRWPWLVCDTEGCFFKEKGEYDREARGET